MRTRLNDVTLSGSITAMSKSDTTSAASASASFPLPARACPSCARSSAAPGPTANIEATMESCPRIGITRRINAEPLGTAPANIT